MAEPSGIKGQLNRFGTVSLFGPYSYHPSSRQEATVFGTSLWARLAMVPFAVFFSALTVFIASLPVSVFIWMPFPRIGSHEFMSWLALWPMCLLIAALFAIPARLTWLCVLPSRLCLDFSQRRYELSQGFRIRRQVSTGPFEDIDYIVVQWSKEDFFPTSYKTVLVWKTKQTPTTLNILLGDQQKAESWAQGIADQIGIPFAGVFKDALWASAGSAR